MIKVKTYRTGPISVNTYIVYDDESKQGFVVDPGGSFKRLAADSEALGLNLCAVLLTHGHFDHIGAAKAFQDAGVRVYIHEADESMLHTGGNLGSMMGLTLQPFRADELLRGGETLNICGMEIKVIHTPGHTEGGVCYILEDKLFSGDTLFRLTVGRTDFPGGSSSELRASVQRLFALPGDMQVYPGHEEPTTLDFERKHNPLI